MCMRIFEFESEKRGTWEGWKRGKGNYVTIISKPEKL